MNPVWKAIARVLKRRRAVERLVAMRGMEGAREAREARECPYCNPTAKAIQRVQAQWAVAGIDKGE